MTKEIKMVTPTKSATPSIYFLEKSYPAKPDQSGVDMAVAYATPKLALEYAKKEIKASKGDAAIIREINPETIGVFVEVAGDLALIYQYRVKAVELKRV